MAKGFFGNAPGYFTDKQDITVGDVGRKAIDDFKWLNDTATNAVKREGLILASIPVDVHNTVSGLYGGDQIKYGTSDHLLNWGKQNNIINPKDPSYGWQIAAGILGGGVGGLGRKVAGSGLTSASAIDAIKKRQQVKELPQTTPGRILNETKNEGGYTVNMATGDVPETGLMMGKYKNSDPRNVVTPKLTLNQIKDIKKKNASALSKPENYLGTWKGKDATYVDVSTKFPPEDIRKATKFGERTGQISGWNLGNKKEFPVGNWDEFVGSKEFQTRIAEMGAEGREYLSRFPTKEWWDMHGTALERIYGEDALPQLAGFIASTAPNTAPRANLQTASEYMRRMIKREETIQPNYRIPANQMNRAEGTKIGMEGGSTGGGRTNNLNKARAGLLGELRLDKVREEASALMGNKDAAVFDRHWARLAEKPEAGVYAAAQEGILPAGKQYATLKEAVSRGAKAEGRSTRDFSADVWTGIRERIKNTSELYGQKFQGSAITGDSKSYADVFEDLIRDKAKHMGITVKEMEKRLKSGDATLMSTLAASPLLYPLLQEELAGRAANDDATL